VAHFKEFIPQAFVGGNSMILDAEVLLIDTNTSKPLPFGTLGVHKVSMTAKCIFPLTSL
jgi:DNA ligase-3